MASFKPTIGLVAIFLFMSSCVCLPVTEDDNKSTVALSKTQNPQASDSKPASDKLRQDGDGDGDDGVGEIELVGQQVSQIITGVLSGNFGQIFGGSTSFIDDSDTQTGVGTILGALNKPLNTILVSGVMSGQKYFNITDPPSILLVETTAMPATPPPPPRPPPRTQAIVNPNAPNSPQSYYLEPIVINNQNNQPLRVAAPVTGSPVRNVPRATTQKTVDDEDDDNDSDGDPFGIASFGSPFRTGENEEETKI